MNKETISVNMAERIARIDEKTIAMHDDIKEIKKSIILLNGNVRKNTTLCAQHETKLTWHDKFISVIIGGLITFAVAVILGVV